MVKKSQKSLSAFIHETEEKLERFIDTARQKLDEIQTELSGISTSKTTASEELGALQQVKTTANSILSDLESYHTKFLSIKEQLDSEDDGMEVNLEWSQKNSAEIEALVQSSEGKVSEIKKIQDSITAIKNKVSEDEKLTSGYKEKIQETFNFMNGQGLAHSFYERKRELEKDMKFWRRILMLFFLILIGLVSWVLMRPPDFLKDFSKIEDAIGLLSFFGFRLFFLSPVILIIWYAATQYSRERSDISQYAFKGGVAKALENYTDLLTDKFVDKKGENMVRDEILKFTIECMKDIYRNPHNDKPNEDDALKTMGKSIEAFRKHVTKPVGEIGEDLKKAVTIIELPKP